MTIGGLKKKSFIISKRGKEIEGSDEWEEMGSIVNKVISLKVSFQSHNWQIKISLQLLHLNLKNQKNFNNSSFWNIARNIELFCSNL